MIGDEAEGESTVEVVGHLGVALALEAGDVGGSSDGFSFSLFDEVDGNFAFAFLRSFVLDQVGAIFMIGNSGRNVGFLFQGSLFSLFLLNNSFSFFFRKGVIGFLCLLIHRFFLRNFNIQSSDFDVKFISSSCSILSFCISGLDIEHSISFNVVAFQQAGSKGNGLVGFGVQEVGEICRGDGQIVFAAADPDLALFRLVEGRGFAFDEIFILEDSNGVNGCFSSEESDGNLPVGLFEASSVDGEFGLASQRSHFGLDGFNCIGRAGDRANGKHPQIVEPFS